MSKPIQKHTRVLLIVVLAFYPFVPAWAYLDPGTGSMLLQMLLGGIAGGIVVIKLYWQRFKNLFKKKSSDSNVE